MPLPWKAGVEMRAACVVDELAERLRRGDVAGRVCSHYRPCYRWLRSVGVEGSRKLVATEFHLCMTYAKDKNFAPVDFLWVDLGKSFSSPLNESSDRSCLRMDLMCTLIFSEFSVSFIKDD